MIELYKHPWFYGYFLMFQASYYILKRGKCPDVISKNGLSLIHSIFSSYYALVTIINMNNINYLNMASFTVAYMLSDTILMRGKYHQTGRQMLLLHHILTMIVFTWFPLSYNNTFCLFLAEFSNIPNNYTYLLIKTKADPDHIKSLKRIQYYFFLIGRTVLSPFIFIRPLPNTFNSHQRISMYVIFPILYSMSNYWMYRLHRGYYR